MSELNAIAPPMIFSNAASQNLLVCPTRVTFVDNNGKNSGKCRQNASSCGSGFEIKSASMNLSLRRYSPDARLHDRQRLD